MDRFDELRKLTTFDLAFNLARGKYSEEDKFIVLDIIKNREANAGTGILDSSIKVAKDKIRKPPLKGSKAEKIQQLIDKGKSAKEIYEALNNKGTKVYYPEIYRLINNQ